MRRFGSQRAEILGRKPVFMPEGVCARLGFFVGSHPVCERVPAPGFDFRYSDYGAASDSL